VVAVVGRNGAIFNRAAGGEGDEEEREEGDQDMFHSVIC